MWTSCVIYDCHLPVVQAGYCEEHYREVVKHG
jgi:hypothetical protein